jgi:hypothetical protein
MMADRTADNRTGDGVPAADFMPGQGANRRTLGRASRLLVGVVRMRGYCEAQKHGGQYDTSHRNLLDGSRCNAIRRTTFPARGDHRKAQLRILREGWHAGFNVTTDRGCSNMTISDIRSPTALSCGLVPGFGAEA